MQHLEIIFKHELHPGDVEIITPASPDQPGKAKLGQARRNGQGRVLSAYGGLIGYVADDEPLKPYQDTYWLEVNQ